MDAIVTIVALALFVLGAWMMLEGGWTDGR